MESRERELHLRLDPDCADNLQVRSLPHQILDQRRLAHTRLAPQKQRAALTLADSRDHSFK
jgi:hypothetical protein